jgi:hypothetical protein
VLPTISHGESAFTLKCEGEQTVLVGPEGAETRKRVSNYYTIYIRGSTGRYYDWEKHEWGAIHSINADTYQLADDGDLRMWWRLSVARVTGEWSELYTGGGHTTSTSGRCEKAPLRRPPAQRTVEPNA